MIIALDTSTPICNLTLISDEEIHAAQWEAGRGLADGLIGYVRTELKKLDVSWSDIDGIVVFEGPGSFTGLRIGLTVMNTIADSQRIPIVGEQGDDWLKKGVNRLKAGDNDELVMPFYGREANITKPRK